jgi:hypothetical protein
MTTRDMVLLTSSRIELHTGKHAFRAYFIPTMWLRHKILWAFIKYQKRRNMKKAGWHLNGTATYRSCSTKSNISNGPKEDIRGKN